jgi:putative transposase
MIRKVHEVDPMLCRKCGGRMEEFYEVEDLALVTAELNRQIEEWEHTYNYIRPHETLDYLTPNEYYRRWKKIQKSQASLML